MNTKSLRSNNATACLRETRGRPDPQPRGRRWPALGHDLLIGRREISALWSWPLAQWLSNWFPWSVLERHRDDAARTNPVLAVEEHDLRCPPWRPDRRTDVDPDAGKKHRHLQVGYRGCL